MIEELLNQSWTQWTALVTGVIYVLLAARANNLCWVFGIVSCACIAWDDFFTFRLYADGVLQVIYIGLGVLGLITWVRQSESGGDQFKITEDPWSRHLMVIASCAILSWPLSLLLAKYTDAQFGYLDTLTTLLSLYATVLLVRKVMSNWLYWIVIDIVYVYIFARSGGLLVAVLYCVFTIVAVYGWYHWRSIKAESIKMKSK